MPHKPQNNVANALIHGLYAKDVLLPWDSKEDFLRLLRELTDEFFPVGRAEEQTVLDLAFLYWRKETLRRLWKSEVLRDKFTDEIVQTDARSWSEVNKRLRASARRERNLLGTLESAVTKGLSEVQRVGMKIAEKGQSDTKELLLQLEVSMKVVVDTLLPVLNAERQAPNPEQAFENSHSPDRLEKIMRLEASLDAQINKVLARLVGLKEFKRTPAGARPANYGARQENDSA